jgi:ribosomal protein L37AE/L43A
MSNDTPPAHCPSCRSNNLDSLETKQWGHDVATIWQCRNCGEVLTWDEERRDWIPQSR